jgi:ubiquinone/menaquinone biosynthesis C-methylase UbiE
LGSLSFDSMIGLYDETRVVDSSCLAAALEYLAERFPPENYPTVFEPGVGTGRIAIPLAQRDYRVTGVDISPGMLDILKRRLDSNDPVPVSFIMADATNLPFSDGAFDIAIAVHLFYFIQEWKQAVAETLRVIKPGHPLVMMHTGTGMEVPDLNQRYKELCAKCGCSIRDVGVKSTGEVVGYLQSSGYQVEHVRGRWSWTAPIPVKEALRYMKLRAYSFTTVAPDGVHARVMQILEAEALRRFGRTDAEIGVPNEIYYVLVAKR